MKKENNRSVLLDGATLGFIMALFIVFFIKPYYSAFNIFVIIGLGLDVMANLFYNHGGKLQK
jgi:hypothetical protein